MFKPNMLTEKTYQKFILERLHDIGYQISHAKDYDRLHAINKKELFQFLDNTQPEAMTQLRKTYKDEAEDIIMGAINQAETQKLGSRLLVLKQGITISGVKLNLLYSKPATTFNKADNMLYTKNIFSVSEEVWASDDERIDLVVFLNGLAIISFELKANSAGQSYEDAIEQYRKQRNPETRLFLFKAGTLVNFAMDMEQVHMTTKLEKEATFFLPFNMGNGVGVNAGAGNPICEDDYSVHYMWDNILQKDSIIEIVTKFMFIDVKEKKDEATGKTTITESIVFPRYHQLDVLRKLLTDVQDNKTMCNYLLQHSAGSGKTNEIAWLAHRLASLHDDDNKIIFDNIIICTDRVVVDRQLQQAVKNIKHQSGFIKTMDEKCTSSDLAKALDSNTKIIVTTIQKFPYIMGEIKNLANKKFAVIIDEAHSSTSGKNMSALKYVLSEGDVRTETADMEDVIADEMAKNGKQSNVAMFAFTATPKPTTLELFGRMNKKGQKEAFHIYSMKQAIEEGFILDVLQNYITYKTYYTLNKEIQDDPELRTNEAKRQIARFVELHDTNIAQRVEVIIEHFRTTVMHELNGTAKAMVVTASREGAVKYRQAFEDYITRKGYTGIKALVAFSGTVTVDGTEYTEVGMNGIAEKQLPAEFDKDDYRVLLVADKYQTGFDQRKLCAMYILKKLHGVSTVQTLSRLNRICPPYDKKTFVLDFANEYDDIIRDFSTYYTTTVLANAVNPASVYEIETKLDGFYILNDEDIEDFNKILYKESKVTSTDRVKMVKLLEKTKKRIERDYPARETRNEIVLTINHFIRCYEFLLQASCFEDVTLHKKYNFISYLAPYLKVNHSGQGFDLKGKIEASGFFQKEGETHTKQKMNSNPNVKLPTADQIVLPPQKTERLSQIIAELNSRAGKTYDNDVAIKAMLQIRDIMMKSDELRASAINNPEETFVQFAYYDAIDKALTEGLTQNLDFFTLLLNDEELKKNVLGVFASEIYKSLKGKV
ncbi:MAG: type I restriction endonuclease subunit R [Agathobacter sp.]|nr:type I restriction endonuclease subunit R [Agathobacter sp.]